MSSKGHWSLVKGWCPSVNGVYTPHAFPLCQANCGNASARYSTGYTYVARLVLASSSVAKGNEPTSETEGPSWPTAGSAGVVLRLLPPLVYTSPTFKEPHTIPYHTIPCHAIPYHAMPCHAMPYHAMPCHDRDRTRNLVPQRAILCCLSECGAAGLACGCG